MFLSVCCCLVPSVSYAVLRYWQFITCDPCQPRLKQNSQLTLVKRDYSNLAFRLLVAAGKIDYYYYYYPIIDLNKTNTYT